MRKIGLVVEVAEVSLLAFVASLLGDPTHFTWWGVGVYILGCVLHIAGLFRYYWIFAITTQSIIISGVIVMSVSGCDLLEEAVRETGSAAYFFGNFFVHYYPFIATFAKRTPLSEVWRKHVQAPLAVTLFAAYSLTHRAERVYGCDYMTHSAMLCSAYIFGSFFSVLISY